VPVLVADEGTALGVDAQIERYRKLAELRGYEVSEDLVPTMT